uniref:Ovule protein n=1 Tax=Ascaris lumbricoides TaxID=6252 RepID=A0A0M3I0B2_ASCLU
MFTAENSFFSYSCLKWPSMKRKDVSEHSPLSWLFLINVAAMPEERAQRTPPQPSRAFYAFGLLHCKGFYAFGSIMLASGLYRLSSIICFIALL